MFNITTCFNLVEFGKVGSEQTKTATAGKKAPGTGSERDPRGGQTVKLAGLSVRTSQSFFLSQAHPCSCSLVSH